MLWGGGEFAIFNDDQNDQLGSTKVAQSVSFSGEKGQTSRHFAELSFFAFCLLEEPVSGSRV